MKTIYTTEVQRKKLAGLLLENEGTNMKRARKYLESKGYSPEKRQQILDSIRTDIPNSRLQQCKFLLGVTRLYMEGQLNNAQNIAAINKTLKYIASDTHVNEYDFNLNGENLDTLVQRFAGVAKDDLQASMNASNARQLTVNNNYMIIPIDSPEEASKYGEYTSWCVTHDKDMYNSYTHNGSGRFYFCLHKGFENEPKIEGDGCPLDNYGLSMIAVSVTMEGEVNTITCRWNHNNGGNDSIMTIEQLEDVIGRNFYQTFKPYTRDELHAKGVVLFDEVQELLDNGKKPEEIFDSVVNFSNGFARVFLNDKYNYINDNRQLISKTWFEYCYIFIDGFSRVELNKKYNFINTNGQIISDTWFDRCSDFIDGFSRVELNDKWNFINTNGQLISDTWFDSCSEFYAGFARVELNDKWNFINTNGQLFSDTWFDYCYNFSEGFAIVKLNDKMNFINTNGQIISDTWFYNCYDFDNGFAIVGLNDKWNFINTNGQLISDTWFDECYNFINGAAWVKLNGKANLINTNGQIIESKGRKTIYITEAQEKKIKKAIAAQDQVGGKVNAAVMDAAAYGGGMCENIENEKFDGLYFETWYRGYDSKYPNTGVPENKGIWITDDIEYAKSYADEFEDGKIAKVVIDVRKINHMRESDMWDLGYDPYDSDKETCDFVRKQGYNSWICYFHDANAYGLCLLDSTPIVSIEDADESEYLEENVEDDAYTLGAEKGMSPYYHVNESNEEIITLYHGVNRKGLEFNLEKGGFVPRVCSEGGPKAVWLSEKQYNYEFTFAFDFPKSLVEQLSNVDYIFTGKIGLNDFNCRLVKTSINSFLDDIVVETNILNDKLSKLHFRYFPDLGITLWKEFEQYPNILETYINPFIEKYQTLSESKKKVVKNDKGEVVPDTCDKCGGEVVVQIHGEPVYVCKDCGKYFGTMPFTLKENIESEIVNPEDVDLSSFNIKKNLNPKFWKNGVLDSRIRMKLLDIADDFIEFLGVDWAKPEDITITGSLANFNWDENYSDIDLHIIMDYSDVDERTEFVSNYFYSQKKLWNEEHSDITIMGYPVEVFVQDINERHDSSGIYSLEKNKWLIEPEREKLVSSKVNKAFIKDKVSEYMNRIDKLEYLLNKSKDDEYRLRRVMEKSDKLFDKIKVERKLGFERSGGKEINNYNIVFKSLRRNGYIEKLVNIKSMAYDKLNSLQ